VSVWLWWRLLRIPAHVDAPVTAFVRELDPALRDHLSDISIHFRGAAAEVSFRFALFRQTDAGPGENPWLAAEQGPSRTTRWPTLARELSLDTPMGAQLENLEISGLVGGLRNARNKHGNNFAGLLPKRCWGPPAGRSWRLLTHAGSDEERAVWRRGNQLRMSRTAGNSEIASIT
jgi:hypothetical protein